LSRKVGKGDYIKQVSWKSKGIGSGSTHNSSGVWSKKGKQLKEYELRITATKRGGNGFRTHDHNP